MSVLDQLLAALDRVSPPRVAHAHCDIPCGIYDPHNLQVAAHTVIRMVQLLEGLPDQLDKATLNTAARHIAVKEEHAAIAEHEIIVLWTDYFKPEHLEKFPDLHDTFWKTAKMCGRVKHAIDMQASQELHENVLRIAEIFWQSKGASPRRQPSLQQAGGELVYPQPQ